MWEVSWIRPNKTSWIRIRPFYLHLSIHCFILKVIENDMSLNLKYLLNKFLLMNNTLFISYLLLNTFNKIYSRTLLHTCLSLQVSIRIHLWENLLIYYPHPNFFYFHTLNKLLFLFTSAHYLLYDIYTIYCHVSKPLFHHYR